MRRQLRTLNSRFTYIAEKDARDVYDKGKTLKAAKRRQENNNRKFKLDTDILLTKEKMLESALHRYRAKTRSEKQRG